MTFRELNSFSRHTTNTAGFTFLSGGEGGGRLRWGTQGGGDSSEKEGDAVGRKIWFKPLKETNLSVARAKRLKRRPFCIKVLAQDISIQHCQPRSLEIKHYRWAFKITSLLPCEGRKISDAFPELLCLEIAACTTSKP